MERLQISMKLLSGADRCQIDAAALIAVRQSEIRQEAKAWVDTLRYCMSYQMAGYDVQRVRINLPDPIYNAAWCSNKLRMGADVTTPEQIAFWVRNLLAALVKEGYIKAEWLKIIASR